MTPLVSSVVQAPWDRFMTEHCICQYIALGFADMHMQIFRSLWSNSVQTGMPCKCLAYFRICSSPFQCFTMKDGLGNSVLHFTAVKCGPWTHNIRFSWKLVRNIGSQDPPQIYYIRNPGVGAWESAL